MTDDAPNILYSLDRAGHPIAIIERRIEMEAEADVLGHYPMLLDGAHTLELARLVNHFAREFKYEVIADPAAFEAAYRTQIAAEDPAANWQQGAPKLRDFGLPDFAVISRPVFDGRKLVYFARSVQLGVPYRAEVTLEGAAFGKATYAPVTMGPIP